MCVLWADGSPRVRKAGNQPCVSGSPSQVMVIALHRLPKGEVGKCRDRQVEACGFPSVWKKKSLLDVPYALPLMNPQNQVLASCFRASPCPHPFWPCFSHRFQTCACNSFSQPYALEPCQPGFDFTAFRAHHLHETLTTWPSICSSFSFSWPPDDSWLLETVLFLLQLYESVFNQ